MHSVMKSMCTDRRDQLRSTVRIPESELREQIRCHTRAIDEAVPGIQKYNALSLSQKGFYQDFARRFPHADLSAFHKLAMLDLISRFPERVSRISIPKSIRSAFEGEFARITQTIDNDESYSCTWSNDVFVKDFGICTFRLIPAGAQLVEISGIPKSWLINGASSRLRGLWYLVSKLKGTQPTYEIHTHTSNLNEFTPEGWNRCYVRIGQLLKLNPEIKAMQGSSWFYDPALASVGPHLTYLREVPCANGAEIFFVANEGKDSAALAKSNSRRQLFAEGKYVPKTYLLVWPREQLIEFAEKNADLLEA